MAWRTKGAKVAMCPESITGRPYDGGDRREMAFAIRPS
jgi:hypothetical protein